ncbi:dihydrofolate reductase [Isoptericola jiangsuensis]|uniref:dihydrofolate reductase n=1 Tax=Isoptericola jiangsuensis TaxID=548579 RepID=UPI003AAB0962
MIGLIWAQARDAAGRPVIGADGAIPWHVPEDFAHFRATTAGHPVVMGRLTWASLPVRFRPLPGRTNVVVTRDPSWADDGAVVASSVPAALGAAAAASGGDEVWVMGGGQVYRAALPLADRCVVTEVDLEVDGDVFAPALDPAEWRETAGPVGGDAGWLPSSGTARFRVRTYARR